MDVRHVVLWDARGPGLGDRRTLGHPLATLHEQLPCVGERCFVTVAGSDRDRESVRRNLTGEGHLPRHGSTDHASAVERDVDSSMLPARVLVVAEGEPS